MSDTVQTGTIHTQIPSRLDRLPWSRFHWKVVLGLGAVWLLDGLEVTMVGSVAARLAESGSGIEMSAGQIGVAAAVYIVGACLGALFFGQLTDRFGRKKLFIITLAVYILATVATAFAMTPWYFYLARFVTGAGIGGEYAAINSAIDELIPARARGRVDLAINGTYWLGAAAGAGMAIFFLNEAMFPANVGWRLAFGFGAVLGLGILLVRRTVPESPRWLFIHGREEEAERIIGEVEQEVVEETGEELAEVEGGLTVRQRKSIPFRMIARTAFQLYPRRAILGLALFIGQAFIYNGVTFNLGTLLSTFYGVASGITPMFIVFWALGNFAGPVILGRLFDTVGRKPMISGCYLGSAALTLPLVLVFVSATGGEWGFMALLIPIFFLASAGASAAYLTVSEVFPMETRALAIAFFYAVGTAAGGIVGPLVFGQAVGSEVRGYVGTVFLVSAAVMAIGGVTELFLGVKAERENLENLAMPLTAQEAESGGPAAATAASEDARKRDAQERRQEAEEERARAAEHRAAALRLPANAETGDRDADDERWAEEALAEAAELRAQALDEQAAAHEELAAAGEAADEHESAAALSRAQAAEQRARGLSQRGRALVVDQDRDATTYHELAESADERARAREQRALAAQARGEAARASGAEAEAPRARAHMYEQWAQMHEARGQIHLARSEDDNATADRAEQQATQAEQRALAAEQEVAAAEYRASSEHIRAERETTEQTQAERAAAAAREQQAAETERRIRERVTQRQTRERTGLRRLRPGPGRLQAARSGGLEPRSMASAEQALDREIEVIARALSEHGATDRHDLAQLVGARYWGPGRFGAALRAAVDEGRARRLSRRTYAPPEDHS